MSDDLFAPPSAEEIRRVSSVKKRKVKSQSIFDPPMEHEIEAYSPSENPPYRKDVNEEPDYNETFSNSFDSNINDFINKKAILPQEPPKDTWSKFKDMMASAGTGFTEGATANKTAEILSRILPIKTDTNQVQSIINRQHEANPISYTVGEVTGMAASPFGGFGKLGKLALPLYSAISGAEGDTLAEKGIGAGTGAALGAATGAVVDKALPYIGSKIPKLTEYAGKALQLPQQASESVLETLGSIGRQIPFLDKQIKPNPKTLENPSFFSDSKRMSDFKKIIDASRMAEYEPKVANIVKSTEDEVLRGLTADKGVNSSVGDKIANLMGADPLDRIYGELRPDEQAVVRNAVAEGFKKRGIQIPDEPVLREKVLGSLYQPSPTDTVRDFVRITNKRDLGHYVSGLKNASEFYTPILENTPNIDPYYYDLVNTNDVLHKKMRQGAINRMMQQDGPPVRGWTPVNQIDTAARDFYNVGTNSSVASSPEEATRIITGNQGKQQAQQQVEKQAETIKMTKPWLGDATDEMIKNRTGINITDQNSLTQAASIASRRAGNVQAGQSLANMAGGLAGFAGGVQAISSHGFPSISSFLSLTPQAMSWAGKAGQGLERKGSAMTIDNFASSFLNNPSVLSQLSQQQGTIGNLGRFLSNGGKSLGAEGVKSRIFVAMSNPTMRKAIMELMEQQNGGPVKENDRVGATTNLNQ